MPADNSATDQIDITATIERNLTGLLADAGRDACKEFRAPTAGTAF